jgi:predicted RNase H-like HicB family nuclease
VAQGALALLMQPARHRHQPHPIAQVVLQGALDAAAQIGLPGSPALQRGAVRTRASRATWKRGSHREDGGEPHPHRPAATPWQGRPAGAHGPILDAARGLADGMRWVCAGPVAILSPSPPGCSLVLRRSPRLEASRSTPMSPVPAQRLTAILHREEVDVAECPEVGALSQGDTVEEALATLREATELFLEECPQPALAPRLLTTFEVSVAYAPAPPCCFCGGSPEATGV